jgi:hypothetical protein
MDSPQQLQDSLVKNGLEHLEKIEEELVEIKDRTANPRRSLINGVFQGIGVLLGSLLGLALLGWILSLLGLIPGLGELSNYLHTLAQSHS